MLRISINVYKFVSSTSDEKKNNFQNGTQWYAVSMIIDEIYSIKQESNEWQQNMMETFFNTLQKNLF